MLIFGIDPGFANSPTGIALVQLDEAHACLVGHWTLMAAGGDWQSRCDRILTQLAYLLVAYVPRRPSLAYELGWVGANAQSGLKLRDLGGGVRGLAAAFGLDCIGVQPAESKRALARAGNADKAAMCAAARARFGVVLSEHEADAAGHALAGAALLQARRGLTAQGGRA